MRLLVLSWIFNRLRRIYILFPILFLAGGFLVFFSRKEVIHNLGPPSSAEQLRHFKWQSRHPLDLEQSNSDKNSTGSGFTDSAVANTNSLQKGSEQQKVRQYTCRNSIGGRDALVDERGVVCARRNLLPGGCCAYPSEGSVRFHCSACSHLNLCCRSFESCVSCCLLPSQRPVLEAVLLRARALGDKVLAWVTDRFQLCLARCRTSSESVQHENAYRDPVNKHCFGLLPPTLRVAKL